MKWDKRTTGPLCLDPATASIICGCVFSLSFLLCPADSDAFQEKDAVVYQSRAGEQPVTRQGQIIDYDARFLTLKLEKIERKIPTAQVKRIETRWLPAHLQGDQQKADGNFSAAIKLYDQAFELEPREWVKRKIRASIVVCYRELGKFPQAASHFDRLMNMNSDTRFFDEIPVAWTPIPPNAATSSQAREWMKGRQEYMSLMGASFELSNAGRTEALSKLQELTRSRDKRIAQMATMQVWRSRLLTARESDVKTWQASIEKIPEPLRAGGYYVIGMAWVHLKNDEQAVISLMRLPIHFKSHYQLAAASLHRAAELIKQSRPDQAERLYRELVERYSKTALGQAAKSEREGKREGNGG